VPDPSQEAETRAVLETAKCGATPLS
jgi:hypothetical protein